MGDDGTLDSLQAELATLRSERDQLVSRVRTLESHISREQSYFNCVLENLPAGVAFLDHDTIFRWVSPEFSRILGMPRDAFLDRRLRDVFPLLPDPDPRIVETLSSGKPQRIEDVPFTYELHGELKTIYWDMSFFPVIEHGHDLNGHSINGVLLFGVDVTSRVERERDQQMLISRLRELNQLKSDFIVLAAHELRTPLTIVSGNLELLQDMINAPSTERTLIDQASEGCRRLNTLVSGMLDITQLEAGTFEFQHEATDLVGLLRDVLERYQPVAEAKQIRFKANLPTTRLMAEVDPNGILRVFDNLVSNAIKFTPSGGEVTVTLEATGQAIRFVVDDTGIGLSEEQQRHVFGSLYQVDPNIAGAGLGLSISRKILKAHGGDIEVKSQPGKGSTFCFTLPIRESPPEAPPSGARKAWITLFPEFQPGRLGQGSPPLDSNGRGEPS